MADFSFISNARFRPFSYQEMIQPLQAYTQEYNTIEEGMGELASKAAVFKQLANEQTDPVSHAMYQKYADDLNSQVESFAKDGLTPASRQGLLNMRKRYSSEIVPIEQAYQNRQKLADWWREAKLKDPSLIANIDPSAMSLDTFLKNPNTAPQYYSGERLKSDVFQLAQQFAKTLRDDEDKGKWLLGDQYYRTLKETGFKPDEVLRAIQGSPRASAELRRLVEDSVSSTGVKEWADKPTLSKFYDWANQGLWGALGTGDYKYLANQAYRGKGSGNGSSVSDRVPYKSTSRVKVNPETKTTQLDDDRNFVASLIKDMNLLNKVSTRYKSSTGYTTAPGTGVTVGEPNSETEYYKPNAERWKDISNRYNTTNPQEVLQAINDEIRMSAVIDRDYFMDYTDYGALTSSIKNAIGAQLDDANVWEWKKNNKRGSKLSKSDIRELESAKEGNIIFDPKSQEFIYRYTTSNGKIKNAILDPALLDDSGTLSRAKKTLDKAIKDKNQALATRLVDFIMRHLDGSFNTKAKIQSNTDAKLDVEYPNIDMDWFYQNNGDMDY